MTAPRLECMHDKLLKDCGTCREVAVDVVSLAAQINEPTTAREAKAWIQSLEGRQVFPRLLTVDSVGSIEEIAHALAGKFRFTCQTRQRYSVAEHCVRGSHLLPSVFAGAFLLHELSEVYLPDIAGPLKPFVNVHVPKVDGAGTDTIQWSELERRHTSVMLEALRLDSIEPLIYSPEVKQLDWAMLAAEKRDLLGTEPAPWGLPHDPAAVSLLTTWSPEAAESAFLERFYSLFGSSYGQRVPDAPAISPPDDTSF